ncbi:hypothetical protein CMV16_17880 [Peribacillus simplex]|jgi:hypothetical protein|nr:hypothetical protein CMV16_17880 [Peribacillus simplex]
MFYLNGVKDPKGKAISKFTPFGIMSRRLIKQGPYWPAMIPSCKTIGILISFLLWGSNRVFNKALDPSTPKP